MLRRTQTNIERSGRLRLLSARLFAFLLTSACAFLTAFTLSASEEPAVRFGNVRLANGVRLHYAETGRPQGEVIIMIHGYSDSWFSYSRVLPLLPESYRAYALDLRGHGESDRPATGYSLPELAADVVAFMNAKGIASATVVGHSLGSMVAQHVALAAPNRVTRLVLIGSATEPRKFGGMMELKEAVYGLSNPISEKFAREFQESTVFKPIPPEFMNRAVQESMKLTLPVWRGVMDGMMSATRLDGLTQYRIPALLLRGEKDNYATPAEQTALLELLPGATSRTYPETGHALHWERPREFTRDLVAFMMQ